MTFGARFVKWGHGLFLFGIFVTFGIVAHYCVGARWPTGEAIFVAVYFGGAILMFVTVQRALDNIPAETN